MVKTKKNTGISIWLVRTLIASALTIVFVWSFPKQLAFNHLNLNFLLHPAFYISLILLPINYGLEFQKWRITLATQALAKKKTLAIQSFFAGLLSGLLTPNMQGNFLGRIYYYSRRNRIPIICLTLVGNLAALTITLGMGILGWLFYKENEYWNLHPLNFWIAALIFLSALLFYFCLDQSKWAQKKWRWYLRIHEILVANPKYRLQTLLLSALRYSIFALQYALMLAACGLPFGLNLLAGVSVIYFITTMIPSAFLGKVGIREGVSLTILAGMTTDGMAILTASLLIWLINILIPAIAGLFICKKRGA